MVNVKKLVESALECLGWPYESPGTNDSRGIDCSGLWVKCFRDQGAKIYHGSNTIFHDYTTEVGKLTSASQLQVGMAVFKLKAWTDADKGNKWYGKEPGNLSHIGMVTSVNPLVITHATSPVCTQDFKIGKWAYWGKIKGVDYGTDPGPSPEPSPSPDPEPSPAPVVEKSMKVYAENGQPVNMRVKPNMKAARVEYVPVGTIVTQTKENGAGWAYIKYGRKSGWMLDCFLVDPDTPDPAPAPDPEPEPVDPIPAGEEMTVWTDNGGPVKMRAKPSISCNLYDKVPCGATVTLVKYGADWCKVNHGIRKGWYIMTKFLGLG